jgi:hypothetical protein
MQIKELKSKLSKFKPETQVVIQCKTGLLKEKLGMCYDGDAETCSIFEEIDDLGKPNYVWQHFNAGQMITFFGKKRGDVFIETDGGEYTPDFEVKYNSVDGRVFLSELSNSRVCDENEDEYEYEMKMRTNGESISPKAPVPTDENI